MSDPSSFHTHPPRLLLTATEAAALMGLSATSLYRLNKLGNVPAPVKVGHRNLWRADELKAWIKAGAPLRQEWNKIRSVTSW